VYLGATHRRLFSNFFGRHRSRVQAYATASVVTARCVQRSRYARPSHVQLVRYWKSPSGQGGRWVGTKPRPRAHLVRAGHGGGELDVPNTLPRLDRRGLLVRGPIHLRSQMGLAPSPSAPGLGSPLPHLHRDWARPCHICTATGLAPATSAPGLGSPLPHLHRDWAHPCHICTATGVAPATSAPGLGSPLGTSATRSAVMRRRSWMTASDRPRRGRANGST
jgi:hypothetical protein